MAQFMSQSEYQQHQGVEKMEAQEVNEQIAKTMGIKSAKITYTNVMEHAQTKEMLVVITAQANKKQARKIKEILIEYLSGI